MIPSQYEIINIIFLLLFVINDFQRFGLKLFHVLTVLFFQQVVILILSVVHRPSDRPADQGLGQAINFVLLVLW